jgi:hypothetical protein
MNEQYCPECGHQNPVEARFCMGCGCALAAQPVPRAASPGQAAIPAAPRRGTDWAAIAAAVLAFLSLRHMSRRAQGTAIVIAFFVLFFGCPMVCGFVMFVMEWVSSFFQ